MPYHIHLHISAIDTFKNAFKIIFKQSYLIIDSMKLYGKYKHVAIWKLSLTSFYHNNLVQASKEHTLKGIV